LTPFYSDLLYLGLPNLSETSLKRSSQLR